MWTEINGWCLNLQAQGSGCVLSCWKTADYLLGKMTEKKLNCKVIFPGKQSNVIYKIDQHFFNQESYKCNTSSKLTCLKYNSEYHIHICNN